MNQEEFERLKETEKAHLRKLKELKQTLHSARRLNTTRSSLEHMSGESRRLLDENSSLVEGLSQEAALNDARMDVALEAEGERPAGAPSVEEAEAREADMQQIRAQELIRQMKAQMGLVEPQGGLTPTPGETAEQTRTPAEKTVSRIPHAPEEPSPAEKSGAARPPEKTIGRKRP